MQKNIYPFKYQYLVLIFGIFFFVQNAAAQNGVGINTSNPKSNFEINGSFGQNVTTVTASTALDATHSVVICNNAATPINITLPDVTLCSGRIYTIKRESTSSANVTIVGTIDGSANLVLTSASESVILISNGTEWKKLSTAGSAEGLPFPMGEVSYFNTTGTAIAISAVSDGSTNMVACNPTSTFSASSTYFDNGGSNISRLRYIGTNMKCFHIACTISMSQLATNDNFVFGIAKNGTVISSSKVIQRLSSAGDIQSTALHVYISMESGDYLELYVGNLNTTSDVNIYSINLFALGM